MALFSRSTKKPAGEKKAAARTSKKEGAAVAGSRNLESVIIKPRVTEKAVGKTAQHVYTFIVARAATKHDVADAVTKLFGVTPVKVNIVNKSPRQFMSRSKSRLLTDKGMKKAYVYLKKGEHIDLA